MRKAFYGVIVSAILYGLIFGNPAAIVGAAVLFFISLLIPPDL